MKGYKWYVFAIIPFILIGVAFILFRKDPIYIVNKDFDKKKVDLELSGYTDKSVNGTSVVKFSKDPLGKISYAYTLKEGAPFPYVGIQFSKKDSSVFDLSSYNYLKIKIKSNYGTRIPFSITTEIPGFSKKELELSYLSSQYVLTVDQNLTEFCVPIKEFKTPNWWYTAHNITEKELKSPDFSKVKTVQLNNCINLKLGLNDRVEIEEISFYKDLKAFYVYSGIFLVFYFGLGLLIIFRKKKVSKTEVNFQYDKTSVVNQQDKDEEAVFGFITSNYSNAELTIIDIQVGIGIHERKISSIIKKKTDLNFKQFLNKLRISEAKRLLSETNLPISEIAFKVGYSNASHFNRVFKSAENCSPNDFRKEHPIS